MAGYIYQYVISRKEVIEITNRKKLILIIILMLNMLYLYTSAASATGSLSVQVDGKILNIDVQPIIENGRAMVPLRTIFEALGAVVKYNAETETVIATKGLTSINLQIGNSHARVNGKTINIEVPARIIDGRTLVPLRFVSEALGASVDWDNVTKTVKIESKQDSQVISKEYKFKFEGSEWSWKIEIEEELYQYFKNLDRARTSDYSVYVSNPYDDPFISQLVEKFKETKVKKNFSERELVDFILAFVQSLKYIPDDVLTGLDEYPKYPLETLVEDGGDCEDTSILLASLYREMGYGVVLLRLSGHMAVGVKGSSNISGTYYDCNGTRYYYVETTGNNYKIGQIPDEYKDKKAKLLFLNPKPIITQSWESNGNKIIVTVNNEGTSTAFNTFVYVAFDAEDNLVYNQVTSETFDIQPMDQLIYELDLNYPRKVYTRILVKIVSDGEVLSSSSSGWFNTY